MTTQLLFTLGLVSWRRRQSPHLQAWLSGGAICTGLAVLLVTLGSSLSGAADRAKVLQATVVVTVLVTVLVILSRNVRQGVLFSAVAAGLITDPIASYLVGILAFNVSMPTGPASVASVVLALGLLSAGILLLA